MAKRGEKKRLQPSQGMANQTQQHDRRWGQEKAKSGRLLAGLKEKAPFSFPQTPYLYPLSRWTGGGISPNILKSSGQAQPRTLRG